MSCSSRGAGRGAGKDECVGGDSLLCLGVFSFDAQRSRVG